MTQYVTCRLTAKNRDQLLNPTLGNRVWATFTFLFYCPVVVCQLLGLRHCVCAGVDGALLQCGSGRDLVPRCQLFSSFNLTSLTPTPPTPTHTPQRQPAPHHLGATSGLWDEAWSAWWPADSAHVHVVDVPQHTSTSVSLRAAII